MRGCFPSNLLVLLMITVFVATLNVCFVLSSSQKIYEFSKSFKFGSASAAYQVEGAWDIDGRSPSIWDKYVHEKPERIDDQSNGDVSADSYHLYKKDIAALKLVGFHHYRFSISFSRVLTNGTILNQKGIDYYNNLIDGLLAENIEPMVTMYHFDLPQNIQDLGGFTNPLLVEYFKNYADVLYQHFGDRVKNWITFNEPYNFCTMGYSSGITAPGIAASGYGEYLCGHHMLQAHSAAYHLYKEKYFKDQKGQIGMSVNSWFLYPKDETVEKTFVDKAQEFQLGWFTNPIFSKDGDYPQVMIDTIGNKSKEEGQPWSRLPKMDEEMRLSLIGSADFLALNYYSSRLMAPTVETWPYPSIDSDLGADFFVNETWTRGKSSWLYVVPEGLKDLLLWIKEKYNNPVVIITENGFSDDGGLNDDGRVSYLKGHIASVAEAINEGCNVIAYTVWSIIDNFEWMRGYTEKFGLFSVDMKSEEKDRIPKNSAKFMKNLVASRKLVTNYFILTLNLTINNLQGMLLGVRRLIQIKSKQFSSMSAPKIVGVCQMRSTNDKTLNREILSDFVERAKGKTDFLFFPECCDYVGSNVKETIALAETLNGETVQFYKQLCSSQKMWMSFGGIHEVAVDDSGVETGKIFNTHIIVNSDGEIAGVYRKLHLFDVDTPDFKFRESKIVAQGGGLAKPIETPIGKIGMQICYDIRFPEASVWLKKQGAQILLYPSAFSVSTGKAHWDILNRSRAIENQCFVISAAQKGFHNEKRASYGHAIAVSPWGDVLSECQEEPEIQFVEIDLEKVAKVEANMPCFNHRRNDVYNIEVTKIVKDLDPEVQDPFIFEKYPVDRQTIFLETELCVAFTNIKCVVPGHVLVATKRCIPRLEQMTDAETKDLFLASCRIAKVLDDYHEAQSTTITVQDGPFAGQTVKHVHCHIMPRKPGDFENNDEIYVKLNEHDTKDLGVQRSLEERIGEAQIYKKLLQ